MASYDTNSRGGNSPQTPARPVNHSVTQVGPNKDGDKADLANGVSSLEALNVRACDPMESSDSSAPWYSTNRIETNPAKTSAKKNGKNFDIC